MQKIGVQVITLGVDEPVLQGGRLKSYPALGFFPARARPCETGAKPELLYFLICVALLMQLTKDITIWFLCQIYPN